MIEESTLYIDDRPTGMSIFKLNGFWYYVCFDDGCSDYAYVSTPMDDWDLTRALAGHHYKDFHR